VIFFINLIDIDDHVHVLNREFSKIDLDFLKMDIKSMSTFASSCPANGTDIFALQMRSLKQDLVIDTF
jgi:hypothetical protein